MSSRGRVSFALLALLALLFVGWYVKDVASSDTNYTSGAVPAPGAYSGLPVDGLSTLPDQVGATWRLIPQDGPFPFPKYDGQVFDNRDGRLPKERLGYYHEYTVPTPGSKDRGARRLVTGLKGELYYTANQHSTFVVVDPAH